MAFMPAVLVTAGIAVLSLMEQQHAPRIAVNDKLVHGLMYMLLAITWLVPILKSKISNHKSQIVRSTLVWLSVTFYGALMEALQRFCTLTRSGEMADLYADAIGALIGVLIVFVITKLRNYVITKKSEI